MDTCAGSGLDGTHARISWNGDGSCPLCAALRERDVARATAMELKTAWDAGLAGSGVLRHRYGAREDETMEAFIARLHREAGLAADLGCAAAKLVEGFDDRSARISSRMNLDPADRTIGFAVARLRKLLAGDAFPEALDRLTQEDVERGMRSAVIETALGEVQLALAGGRNPQWGPLAQAVVGLRGYVRDAASFTAECLQNDPRPAELLAACQMAVAKAKNPKGPTT